MRTIKLETDTTDFQKIFKELKATRASVVTWQLDDSGKRSILSARLISFHIDAGKLHFEFIEDGKISSTLPLYSYVEDSQLIFKSKVLDLNGRKFSVTVPDEIRLLDEPDVTDVRKNLGISTVWKGRIYGATSTFTTSEPMRGRSMSQRSVRDIDFLNQEFISVDEEDKLFADKRESPRARPKGNKRVMIRVEGFDSALAFRLFDLSRGGLAYIVGDENLFPIGSKIQIMGFDEFKLDDPLLGQVMGIRPMDEAHLEFKVGIKFVEN